MEGHIDSLVVAVWRLSRRWKVKTLLAGPSPTSPMERRLPTPPYTQGFRIFMPIQRQHKEREHLINCCIIPLQDGMIGYLKREGGTRALHLVSMSMFMQASASMAPHTV